MWLKFQNILWLIMFPKRTLAKDGAENTAVARLCALLSFLTKQRNVSPQGGWKKTEKSIGKSITKENPRDYHANPYKYKSQKGIKT